MEFEWDSTKASSNLRKHGISFEEAASVFGDQNAVTFDDPEHSFGEQRWITFGYSTGRRLLIVSHMERGERVRIISAREATKHERKIYEEG